MAEEHVESLRVGTQGRVVIPGAIRHSLGIELGTVLVGHVEDSRLILERRDAILSRIQGSFARAVSRDISLVDELVAERREEARREAGET